MRGTTVRLIRRALHRHRRDERGAVAVEAAIILPVVALLVFGMIEFSLLLRDYVSVTSATRSGARVASAAADSGPGTCPTGEDAPACTPASSPALAQSAAQAVQNSLTGVDTTSINYLLVYKSNAKGYPGGDTNTTMPSDCSGIASCVKFTWSAEANAFRYSSGTWDSKTIEGCIPTQDNVGIFLSATHKWITGLFGSTIGISDKAVMKFEPLSEDTCDTTRPHPHS